MNSDQTLECPFCEAMLTSQSNMTRHLRKSCEKKESATLLIQRLRKEKRDQEKRANMLEGRLLVFEAMAREGLTFTRQKKKKPVRREGANVIVREN